MAIKFLSGLNLSNVTAGSILKLDSNGNIVAAVDGTDYNTGSADSWSDVGSDIYRNSDVRIGTYQSGVAPAARLHVFDYQTTDPKLLIEDGNTGDASMEFKISTQSYTMGIDNSDSDKFVLAASTALGTTNVLEISTTGTAAFQDDLLVNGTMYSDAADISGRLDVASDLRIRGNSGDIDQGVVRQYVNSSNTLFIDAGNDGNNVGQFKSDGSLILNSSNSQGLSIRQSANSGNDMQVEIRGSRNAPAAGVNPAKLILSSYDNDDGSGVVKTGAEFYMESTSLTGEDLSDFEVGLRYRKDGSVIDGISIHDGKVTAHGDLLVNNSANFNGNVEITGDTASPHSDNAFLVLRGSDGSNALRVQNSGEVVVQNNYLYAAGTGTSLYVQANAVFRGNILNDTSSAPVTIADDLVVTGNVGIGTTNPIGKFHISDSSDSLTAAFIANTGTGSSRLYFDASNGDFSGSDYMWIGQNNDLSGEIFMPQSSGSFHIKTQPSGTITSQLSVSQNGTITLGSYGAGLLKTNASGVVSLDTNTYSTATGVEDNADVTDATNVAAAGALMKAGGTVTGQVIFPSASTTKPVLPNGYIARNDNTDTDGTHDIWGISERYYPSNSTDADAWGIQWAGTPNEINFIGAGQKKLSIDLDTAGTVKIDGNAVATESYVGTAISNLVDSSPAALDTLNELAAALGDDASFSTTMSTALGNRLRIDVNNQSLSSTELANARTNLGLGTAATSNTGDFATSSHSHSIHALTARRSGVNIDTIGNDNFWETTIGTQTDLGTKPTSYVHIVSFGDETAGLQFGSPYSSSTALYYRQGTDNGASENGANTYKNWRRLLATDGGTMTGDLTLDDGSGASPSLYLKNGDDNYWRIFNSSSLDLTFRVGTTTKFDIDSSGNGTFAGTISATNFSGSSSGTNTGDQTLPTLSSLGALSTSAAASTYLPLAGGTMTGALTISAAANAAWLASITNTSASGHGLIIQAEIGRAHV